MDEVTITTPSDPGPPQPPTRWPLYVFVAILAILAAFVIGGLAATALHRAAPRTVPTITTTATAQATSGAATATPSGPGATAAARGGTAPTPLSGGPTTATPTTRGTETTATPAARVGAVQPPTNPTVLHVADGTCTQHRIAWTWAGAHRATAFDVVLYNPITQAEVRAARTRLPAYTLRAGPGATVALKVRSRNSAGTARDYFTPGTIGRVPPHAANPRQMTVATRGHTITWTWSGARHATAYDVVLYHYHGATATRDIVARTTHAHWGTAVTPGIAYYLKVRAVGPCAGLTFYTPARAAKVGA